MPSILVICYDTSSGKYLAQLAGSAQITDGAITSGKIASGIVGTVHLRDGAVTSAKIASGFTTPLGDESVTSAKLASGAVGGDRIWDGGIISGKLASGSVAPWSVLGNAIIISSKIASGIIGGVHLVDAAITSGKIASGIIAGVHIKDASILSGQIGAGVIGDTLLSDFGLISGKYASGSITEQALASGISIDIAEVGQEPSYRAGELISAFLGVQFSTSGYYGHAQAADADTMPAVGLAIANIASGALGTFHHTGRIGNPSWDFSGHVGELLFLGTSSQVTVTAPSASGQCAQRVGKVIDPTTIFLRPELIYVQLAE